MKRNDKRQLDVDRKIAEAFGTTDEQLAEELDWFAKQAEKSDNRALDAPEGEFQRIWDRVEREHNLRRRRGGRIRKLAKVLAVAAILGTMVLGGGMWVGAKRHYVYEVRERKDLENVITINNSPDNVVEDDSSEEDRAYRQIEEELQIQVLELSYLPEKFKFYELTVVENRSRMIFINDNNTSIFFYQGSSDKPTSFSYASDMKRHSKVYNSFLDEEIVIFKNELDEGEIEFSARLIHDHQYYILQGEIDESEFAQIVQGIKYYN